MAPYFVALRKIPLIVYSIRLEVFCSRASYRIHLWKS